jgi:hypothetical protein
MTAWQKLDDYLDRPFSEDTWSDYAFEQAIALVQVLTPSEFALLASAWRQRPLLWQVRCAEILPWAAPPNALPLLREMRQSASTNLAEAAADSLRELSG